MLGEAEQGQHTHAAEYQNAMEFNKKETLIFLIYFFNIFKILDINYELDSFMKTGRNFLQHISLYLAAALETSVGIKSSVKFLHFLKHRHCN